MTEVQVANTLEEALRMLGDAPEAHVLAGGTDVMVEVNHGLRRPLAIVSVNRVAELRGWSLTDDGRLRIGAATTYTELLELHAEAPALAAAARTVGSPQIRNAGTIGGNLGTASPAGDTLPVLAALDAEVVTSSRTLPVHEFITGPKRNALAPGELIVEVRIAAATAAQHQEFIKVGTRNAMVIAVAGVALIADAADRTVRVALGSVGPTPIRARDAEAWAGDNVDWDHGQADVREFGRLVAAAARPIDDHRSTAGYRRHAIAVTASRALQRALTGP